MSRALAGEGTSQKVARLTLMGVAAFWLPLAAMWVMMGLQQPFMAAIIARLPEPKEGLAAFGLAFSMALLVESPVIMLLTASTALADHPIAYRRLLRFTHIMAVLFGIVHFLVALPPVFDVVVGGLIGAPPRVVPISQRAFLLLLPWTPTIAYRRLWDGLLIRHGYPRYVSYSTAIRLAVIFGTALIGLWWGQVNGAYVGAIALSVGVSISMLTSYLFARKAVLPDRFATPLQAPLPEAARSWRRLFDFYLPLALTSVIFLVGQPLLSVGLSRAALPLSSLAIWPVLMGLSFLARSMCVAYQEVTVALLSDPASYRVLRTFALILALATSGIFAIVVVTPLADLWFRRVSGLTADLARMARWPAILLIPVPALSAWQSLQRGILVRLNRTRIITLAVGVNLLVLTLVMAVGIWSKRWPGAVVAATAYTAALAAECVVLWVYTRDAITRLHALSAQV